MDAKSVLALAGSLVAAVGGPAAIRALFEVLFPHPANKLRGEIDRNLDLYSRLPVEAKSRDPLLQIIDDDATQLVTSARISRRDPMSIGLGLTFIALAIGAGLWASNVESWLRIPLWVFCAVLGLFAFVGVVEGFKVVPRDVKGGSTQVPGQRAGDFTRRALADEPSSPLPPEAKVLPSEPNDRAPDPRRRGRPGRDRHTRRASSLPTNDPTSAERP